MKEPRRDEKKLRWFSNKNKKTLDPLGADFDKCFPFVNQHNGFVKSDHMVMVKIENDK